MEDKQEETPKTKNRELEFTGNWFIDAGILGFVNLMEEVYGWNLYTIQDKVNKLSERELKGRFVYAFWYKVLTDTSTSWIRGGNFDKKNLDEKYNLKENKLNNLLREYHKKKVHEECILPSSFSDKNNVINSIILLNNSIKESLRSVHKEYDKAIKKNLSWKQTIFEKIDNSGLIAYNQFFTNLYAFNPGSNRKGNENEIMMYFYNLIDEYVVREEKRESIDALDKSLTPFLYSSSDINIYYGKNHKLQDLERFIFINPLFFVLSFPFSFLNLENKIFFYTNSLKISYELNKAISIRISNLNNRKNLFQITWNSLIDYLLENKSKFFIENLYIIEYSGVNNQQLENVRYIGISKLQASIIIDDQIRSNLNKNMKYRRKEGNIRIMEEFVRGNSLFPIVLGHTYLRINGEIKSKYFSYFSSLYYLIIDSVIKSQHNPNRLFYQNFFEDHKNLSRDIKKEFQHVSYNVGFLENMFSPEEREKIARDLISPVKNDDKNQFLNILLKNLNSIESKNNLNYYIFNNIINNNWTWQNYALALVIGMIKNG